MYQKLGKPRTYWGIWGYVCLLGNIALMAFYCVVTGWMFYYFYRFATGSSANLGFEAMITNPGVSVIFLFITVALAFLILSFNLQNGLERITKVMMCTLLVLLVILAFHSFTLPGAKRGLAFYLIPNFSKINGKVAVGAMNQAFFTISVGMGSMAIFGSYIDKDHTLMAEAVNVITLDTFVAVIAGLIIFPACYSYDLEVIAGPSLLFDTMATVFTHMAGGRWWGTLFFLFMVFAAMSTVLGVCENILAMVRELTGLSRPKGSLLCGIGIFLLGLTTALGYSLIHFQPFSKGTTWLDLWDFLVSTNILPLGSLLLALFCCNKIGWGWDKFLEEANAGKGMHVKSWMKPLFRYVVPVVIFVIYIYGIAHFKWR
jgi:NSS family neurotransmitter:Na+ symporter